MKKVQGQPLRLQPAERARVLRLPVERIDLSLAGMQVRLRTDGPQSKGMQLDELTRAMLEAWEKQREHRTGSYWTESTRCC